MLPPHPRSARPPQAPTLLPASGLFALLCACSSGGSGGAPADPGGPSASAPPFGLVSMSVVENDIWHINRPIEFRFNAPVNFLSVGGSTIRIRNSQGVPAVGEFELAEPDLVIFRPRCPLEPDLSDAGLEPGSVAYHVEIPGLRASDPPLLHSLAGEPLAAGAFVSFLTSFPGNPAGLFVDLGVGPPTPVLRTVGSGQRAATYLELGGDASQRIYLEFDPATLEITRPEGLPLNLYSDPDSALALVIEFDQAVDPSPENLSGENLGLEFQLPGGAWEPVQAEVELVANCTASGATVRLEPREILPRAGRLRAVIRPGFADIAGEAHSAPVMGFAIFETRDLRATGLPPIAWAADELREEFELTTYAEVLPPVPVARAVWADGALSPAFDFELSPTFSADFDLLLEGEGVLQTEGGTVLGGPGALAGQADVEQVIEQGRLFVRNLTVAPGARLAVRGPHPLRIFATGEVDLSGRIGADGDPGAPGGKGSAVGGAGQAGGGSGGQASGPLDPGGAPPVAGEPGGDPPGSSSAALGGGSGGQGGHGRARGSAGGGGGGAFGPPAGPAPGLSAQPGGDGGGGALGSALGPAPPAGGDAGSPAFLNSTGADDFWGQAWDPVASQLLAGELSQLGGGSGGGAGGLYHLGSTWPARASQLAGPAPGGGGGGGGALEIRALGTLRLGPGGRLSVRGGSGGDGQAHPTLGRGAGGGGGSGGHLVLMASRIDLSQAAAAVIFDARGGPGGAGAGHLGAGGAGGAGLIQLHPGEPQTDLVLPPGAGLTELAWPAPRLVLPPFDLESAARSTWIPLGGATLAGDGGPSRLSFAPEGLGPDGLVPVDSAGFVPPAAALLDPLPVEPWPGLPRFGQSSHEVILDASPLVGTGRDLYLRNPHLLERCVVRVGVVAEPAFERRHEVVAARYEPLSRLLHLSLDPLGPAPAQLSGGPLELSLEPRSFRVSGSSLDGFLGHGLSLRLVFQTTRELPDGSPDDSQPLTPWTADPELLSHPEAAWYRFEVRFALDPSEIAGWQVPPALDFLRLPFRF